MIDLRLLRDDPDQVRRSQAARGADPGAVDRLLAADRERRAAARRYDDLRAEQRILGKAVAAARGPDKAPLLVQAKELATRVREAEADLAEAEAALRAAHLAVANVVAEGVQPGGEQDYVVLVEDPRPSYDFHVRDHLALGELLRAVDVERGAKVSGARFYYLTGVGALLEFALVNLALARAVAAGFVPVVPPALVKPAAMEGTGFLGAHAAEVYRLAEDELYLVGTSEVPLAAYHAEEILPAEQLPARYAGFSSCFRREAGSYGKDTRGIIRVHQFDKVEMFSFCRPEDAAAEHERLLGWERAFLGDLELPVRVIDIAAGDLGASAARKYDCEVWLPSQQRWLELTSASNCTTFQARRLNVRFREQDTVRPLATLNGTLCAVARTIVALLEVHQRADGSVRVPPALAPYLGGRTVLEPES